MNRVIFAFIIALIMGIDGCTKEIKVIPPVEQIIVKPEERETYLKIVTSNKLLYHMVKDIVEDKHNVSYMLEGEADQWNFNYSEDSITNISRKDLFIFLGASYEPWVDKFVEGIKNGKVGIVNASRGIRQLYLSKPKKYKDYEIKENSYYWLSVEDYKVALSNIKNSIQEKDPKNRDVYEANFSDSIKIIDKYNKDMKALAENLKKYNFAVISDRLDYFVKGINLKTVKIDDTDIAPGDENKSDKKLGELKDIVVLYDNQSRLDKYEDLIKKYNMKPVHITVYDFDMDIYEIMKSNYDSLNKLCQASQIDDPGK